MVSNRLDGVRITAIKIWDFDQLGSEVENMIKICGKSFVVSVTKLHSYAT